MTDALFILIPIALAGVVFVLGRGLFAFMQEGEAHRRRSNRMMQWRIGLQFVAVALVLLLVLLSQA